MAFCPWCGAPIPDQLHRVEHTPTSYFDHTVICVRCSEKTFFQDGCEVSDKEIAELLNMEKKEVEE